MATTTINTTHEDLVDTLDAIADILDIDVSKVTAKLERFDTTGELRIKTKPTGDKKPVDMHITIT